MKMKINKNAIGQGVQVTLGGIGGKVIKNLSGKVIKNDKLRAAAPFVVGLMLAGNKKTQLWGFGMMAVAGADLAGTMIPALAGIEDMNLEGVFDELTGGDDMGDDMNGPLNDDMGDDMGDDMAGPLNDELGDYGEDY